MDGKELKNIYINQGYENEENKDIYCNVLKFVKKNINFRKKKKKKKFRGNPYFYTSLHRFSAVSSSTLV